jgi:hypothetical protein
MKLRQLLWFDDSRIPSVSLGTNPLLAYSLRRKPFACSLFGAAAIEHMTLHQFFAGSELL